MATSIVTIPKSVSRGDELVVVRKRDFEAYRKWQAEVRDALKKVKRGRKEYRVGTTIAASSPRSFRKR